MALVSTDAIVLHVFDYLESSRILRLLTREAGLISVIAKGARRTRAKYGSALDLFAEGHAQVYIKPSRDLNTLGAFEITNTRELLTSDIDRIFAASAISELVQRIGGDDPNPHLFEAVSESFEVISRVQLNRVAGEAIGSAWRIMAHSGFSPAIDQCSYCHREISHDMAAAFSAAPGGIVCDRCLPAAPNHRTLPSQAREALRRWLSGFSVELSSAEAKAHQRLLREFLIEHISDTRPLKAFTAWEGSTTSNM